LVFSRDWWYQTSNNSHLKSNRELREPRKLLFLIHEMTASYFFVFLHQSVY
jgi:hypothetical protein